MSVRELKETEHAFPVAGLVSIVIPTKNRSDDLKCLIDTIARQSYEQCEIVIVDDSSDDSSEQLVESYRPSFESRGYIIKYKRGGNEGSAQARNSGISNSNGEFVLFLDDDTLLDDCTIESLVSTFHSHPDILGIQPAIDYPTGLERKRKSSNILNAVHQSLMLSYDKPNTLSVRRSGRNIFPNPLTKEIHARRMSGCCFSLRGEVLTKFRFDRNLRSYSYLEDVDLSYRVYKSNTTSLIATPAIRVRHNESSANRLESRKILKMRTTYRSYVFFKDFFDCSVMSLFSFLYSMAGDFFMNIGFAFLTKRTPIYLLDSISAYAFALTNLKSVYCGNLVEVNDKLKI